MNISNEKKERQKRILARGEHSNHSHAIIGEDVTFCKKNNKDIIVVGPKGAILKHLLEKEFVETGTEIWTKEHKDIELPAGEYSCIIQQEYNPYNKMIQQVKD